MIRRLSFCCVVLSTSGAQATQDVGSATVERGRAVIETRAGLRENAKGNQLRLREHFDYGFTDNFALRLISHQQRTYDEAFHLHASEVEGRYQFASQKADGWDGGMRLSLRAAHGDSNANRAGIKFIAALQADAMQYTFNADAFHEFGPNREEGPLLDMRVQALYEFFPRFEAGAEMFNYYGSVEDFTEAGKQRHQAGPVAKLVVAERLNVQTGYLFGLTGSSPRGEAKLFVAWEL